MKRSLLVLVLLSLPFLACDDSRKTPAQEQPAKPVDPNTATIEFGQNMIGELVKPGQTLIHVIQSPPEYATERGSVCFVYFNSAIGSEYVLWNPNNNRTVVWHSNGVVEVIPSGRTSYWEGGFTPHFCKEGRDENFKKIVRKDLLKTVQN
jgi:hypothetical protein